MASQNTRNIRPNALRAQLLLMRIGALSIPVYLIFLSPTCGVLGLFVSNNGLLFGTALSALPLVLLLSLIGVLKDSNFALGMSGLIMTFLIIMNTTVSPYYTILDFTLLILFLEVTTTLASFSSIAVSIEPGKDENVTYNFRLALGEYTKRAIIIVAITLAFSLGVTSFTSSLSTPIGVPGIALLTTMTLFIVFIALALRYRKR